MYYTITALNSSPSNLVPYWGNVIVQHSTYWLSIQRVYASCRIRIFILKTLLKDLYKETSFLNNTMASWTYYPFPVGLQLGSEGVNIYLFHLTYYHTDMLIEFCFNYLILFKWKKYFLKFAHWSPVCTITLPLASGLYTKICNIQWMIPLVLRPAPLPVL